MTYQNLLKALGIVPMLWSGLAFGQTSETINKVIPEDSEISVESAKHNDEVECNSTIKKETYKLKTTYRFQNLLTGQYNAVDGESFNSKDISTNMLVRRARIKLEGVPQENFKYKMEIGLSNRDHGSIVPQTNRTARLILDAYVTYTLPKAKNFSIRVGQMKLAGNRERVISSQRLQFVDRSLVNSNYNIDRDIAIQANHKASFESGALLKSSFSLAQGEGRNITTGNEGGYEYTARVEFLPFGKFHEISTVGGKRVLVASKGDYISADFAREKCPKLSVGLTYDQNNNAVRRNGNLRNYMTGYRTLQTIFADLMFKYNGLSVMAEYANKQAPEGAVLADSSYFHTGTGVTVQAGYIFKRNGSDLGKGLSEVSARYTTVTPNGIEGLETTNMYTLGYSRYVDQHNIKVQTDFSLTQTGNGDPQFMYRLQLEMALSGFKIK